MYFPPSHSPCNHQTAMFTVCCSVLPFLSVFFLKIRASKLPRLDKWWVLSPRVSSLQCNLHTFDGLFTMCFLDLWINHLNCLIHFLRHSVVDNLPVWTLGFKLRDKCLTASLIRCSRAVVFIHTQKHCARSGEPGSIRIKNHHQDFPRGSVRSSILPPPNTNECKSSFTDSYIFSSTRVMLCGWFCAHKLILKKKYHFTPAEFSTIHTVPPHCLGSINIHTEHNVSKTV